LAYPITEIHTGDRAKGEAILFYDDPVFLTERGLCSLGQKSLSLQRSVLTRSSLVSAHLLSEDLSERAPQTVAKVCGAFVISGK